LSLPPPPPGPLPTLLIGQAQFTRQGSKPVPGPAKLVLLKTDGERWYQEVVEDPESNVIHKAIAWRGGLLTIGAESARLVHWTRGAEPERRWTPSVIWQPSWGGKFDRLRDLEVGDVDGDGQEDLILATHDQGVVAVGVERDGKWLFHELDRTPDIFVHEVEVGDVDGDGKAEFYATPTARNRASGESQPGGVARYTWVASGGGGAFERQMIAQWGESHAKELLVADTNGDGRPELYAVREAHTVKEPGANEAKVVDPVRVVRLDPGEAGQPWKETVVASLEDRQCRVLIPADLNGDGRTDLVAAGWKSGLWWLAPKGDGTFEPALIDKDSTGFEHASHVADLDGDGKPEIYVAADDQRAVRRYAWNGSAFDRTEIARIPEQHITWNIQDAKVE
jgi:hypothetical protein